MSCNAIGNPLPILSWAYNGETSASPLPEKLTLIQTTNDNNPKADAIEIQLINNTRAVIQHPNPNTVELQLLVDDWPTGEHRFDCIAVNAHHRDERSVFIERVSKPTFSTSIVTDIQIVNGSSVTLDCNVTGYPPPDIMWLNVCKCAFS